MSYFRRNIGLICLMILALVTAGVSPACAFVSGKMTIMEICGADGLMKVAMPADEGPASTDQQKHDCGFCLAQTMGKALTTPATAIIDFEYVYNEVAPPVAIAFAVPVLDGRLPVRGPPSFL